jgi:hypothetical protein
MKLTLEKATLICPNCHMEIKDGEMVTWTQAGGQEQHVTCPEFNGDDHTGDNPTSYAGH